MPTHRLLCLALVFASCQNKPGKANREPWNDIPAFWIWNQTDEIPQGTHPLYIQVAEVTPTSIKILQQEIPTAPHVAVVRLPPGRSTLEDPALKQRLFSYLKKSSPTRLQLDYDCASMNLASYRRFIESLRREIEPDFFSITALASWINAPGFDELARSVDEITPMFYDLEIDQASEILSFSPRPLIDRDTISWIAKWQTCPTTWRAGLPNYQRLSLFQASGKLVGHLQRWVPTHLPEISKLDPLTKDRTDIVIYRVGQNQRYQGVELQKDQLLIWRRPGEEFTKQAITASRDSGASGLIWFAHPDSSPVAWHSTAHLSSLSGGHDPLPDLQITIETDGSVSLTNHGPGDFLFHPFDGSSEVRLETKSAGRFARLMPGEFDKISAPGSSLVRPQLIRTISLSFFELRALQSINSGPGLIRDPESNPPINRLLFQSQ